LGYLKDKLKTKESTAILSILGLFTCNYILWKYSPTGIFSYLTWCFTVLFLILLVLTFLRCEKLKKQKIIVLFVSMSFISFLFWITKPPKGFDLIGLIVLLVMVISLYFNFIDESDEYE